MGYLSTSKGNESLEEFHKYRDVFPKAWKRFLKRIEEGEILHPAKGQEALLRYHLFAECLLVMREEMFSTPYLISAEVEISAGKRADFTLGVLDEGRPLVAVEIKCFPRDLDIVVDLVEKIGEYVRNDRVIYGFFAMIGDGKYINAQSLDLTTLGIEKDGEYSFYEWYTLKPTLSDVSVETLLVGFMSR